MTSSKGLNRIIDMRPRIIVIGVGGAGCNAVNNMIDAGLDGVTFVAANTDAQALAASQASTKIQLGASLTEGLGAGSKPEIGEAAAEEALPEISELVAGAHMVFIAAGMGGGTGTGAAAVIARAARNAGILTVAVVTKPFQFEGARRMRIAEAGVEELRGAVDTLIVIPNQNLFRIASDKTTFAEAFVLADQVLYSGVACIVDLIIKEGLINLDFADVRTVMGGMGSAMMGTGEASGNRRAILAAEEAITNPLLDDVSLRGAKGLLLSISGGNLTLFEVDEAAERVRAEVDPDATIIVGATVEPSMGERVRVSIVASGIARPANEHRPPVTRQEIETRQSERVAVASSPTPERTLPAATPSLPQIHRPELQHPPLPADIHHAPLEPQNVGTPIYSDHPASLEERLSSALNADATHEVSRANADAHSSVAVPPPVPYAPPSWHNIGDVEIEERRPAAFASRSAYPIGGEERFTARSDTTEPPAFRAEPPAEIRRTPRRMPEVGDFPAHGQREYYAKTGHPAGHPSAQPGSLGPNADTLGYGPGKGGSERGAPKKRKGFFERLRSLGQPEIDSASEPADPVPRGSKSGSPSSLHQGTQAEREPAARHDDSRVTRAEKPELPVFFSKNRR